MIWEAKKIKQCKRVVYSSIHSIDHRYSLDCCSVSKQRYTKKYGISQQGYDFTVPIYIIQGIKKCATNSIVIGGILVCWKFTCNVNDFHQIHILCKIERVNVAVDQFGQRNIHLCTIVGIWQSIPLFYLFRFLGASGTEGKGYVTLPENIVLIL